MNQSNFVRTAIIIFIMVIMIVPFYESKKIIIWQTQSQKQNLFSNIILNYAYFSENVKKNIGLDSFFSQERDFWAKIKESPVVFQTKESAVVQNNEEDSKQVENSQEEKEQYEKLAYFLATDFKKATGLDLSLPPVQGADTSNEVTGKYLIIGDSFVSVGGGLGDVVEKAILNSGNATVDRRGVNSSGLSRIDYFDWSLEIRKLIAMHKPNKIIIMFGANDNQNLADKKGQLLAEYITDSWKKEYARRVDDVLEACKENNIAVFWVGLPIMKQKWFSERVGNLNLIYEIECQKYQNAHFVSTWKTLADSEGNYTAYLKDERGIDRPLRLGDGIHLTYFGGTLITNEIFKKMNEVLD